jgi:hypothetical protein
VPINGCVISLWGFLLIVNVRQEQEGNDGDVVQGGNGEATDEAAGGGLFATAMAMVHSVVAAVSPALVPDMDQEAVRRMPWC